MNNTALGPVYNERGLQQAGYQIKQITLAYPTTHTFPLFFLRRVYKAGRVTRVSGLPYLRARVTLGSITAEVVPGCRVTLSVKFCF